MDAFNVEGHFRTGSLIFGLVNAQWLHLLKQISIRNILIVIFQKGNEILHISTPEKNQKFPVKDGCIEWNGFKFD